MDLYKIRKELTLGKQISNIPLRVTYYSRVSTDSKEQNNSLKNQENTVTLKKLNAIGNAR